jgi:hypothetical protein
MLFMLAGLAATIATATAAQKEARMNWCDERLGIAAEAGMPSRSFGELQSKLASLPIEDLVRGWREINVIGLRDHTDGIFAFQMYFDRLGTDAPERALAFVLSAVANEPDDVVLARLAHAKLLWRLRNASPRVVEEFEKAAHVSPRLRWLLGRIAWTLRGSLAPDESVAQRLLPPCQ